MGEKPRTPAEKAGLLHDLANVVAGITRLAESALRRFGEDHPAREDVEAIDAACRQGAALVRELLEGAPPPGRPAELNELAAGEVRLFTRAHPGLRARVTRSAEPLRVRMADADLRRVLSNLLLNAGEALGGRGEIAVRVGRAPGPEPVAVIEVRDGGSGMDASTLARIFEPGFTTRPGDSRGQGLKVVKTLVDRSGGAVRVASAPGKGTLVRVRLPVVPARGTGTILLVDDQPAVRASVRTVLSESGYRVLEASDGRGALRLLDGGVDLLLTDLKLPDMDGAELAKTAALARPGLKVAFLSGTARPRDAGAEYLVKPAQPDELRERIGALLRK